MNPHAFRSALRIARRDALRHRWRSLLVVLLIGFPVFVLGCADIAYRSWQLDPSERLTREMGAADAAIRASSGCGVVEQAPRAWLSDGYRCSQAGEQSGVPQPGAQSGGPQPTTQSPLTYLPPGTRAVERVQAEEGARIRTRVGVKYAALEGFDYADPMVHGMVKQLHGRAPRAANEVALTTALARSTGLHVGDTMHLLNPDRTMTVVGIVRDARYRKIQTAYSLPAAVARSDPEALTTTWYVTTPAPVDWNAVLRLNQASFVVLSRAVYLDPPPRSLVPFYSDHAANHVPTQVIATVSLVTGMALLEVILLAGPAFAVGARRQRRDLALIAATGGQARDLRNVVLANGVVLGVIAGASAALGAIAAGFAGIPTLGTLVDQIPGHIDVRPLELAGIACLSLLTALLAAVFPAVQAARTDVVAALAGRRGSVRTRRHVPAIGIGIAVVGALTAIVGVTHGNGATIILAGVVITEVGLIVCTPALLGAAARLGRVLPLGPRIALRDAGRNRSAATPAVAAVMAAMIGAVGILIGITSAQDHERRSYVPTLPNHAVAALTDPSTPRPAGAESQQVVDALRASLPTDQIAIVRSFDGSCVANADSKVCRAGGLFVLQDSRDDERYQGGEFPPVLVDDGSGIAALFGKPEPAAVAALRAGHAVVTSGSELVDGKVSIGMLDLTAPPASGGGPATVGAPLNIAAVAVTDGFAPASAIIPPSAAARFGTPTVAGVTATTTRPPTDQELQVARGRLQAIDPVLALVEETGYHDPSQWVLYAMIGAAAIIALGAASIATALANADGRDDLVTLGAVGASPRTRRVMSMSRAGVIAGLGCAVGVVAGFVPAYAWARGDRVALAGNGGAQVSLRFVVPWSPILLALFGIPAVAALLAGAVTRSRLPSERHAE